MFHIDEGLKSKPDNTLAVLCVAKLSLLPARRPASPCEGQAKVISRGDVCRNAAADDFLKAEGELASVGSPDVKHVLWSNGDLPNTIKVELLDRDVVHLNAQRPATG